MESILAWNTKEGMIFRGGSGSGINLSTIRGSMEPLAKGGTASGPVSFMRGADSWAGTIKSGGKTRRAAKMVVLDVDHPDIREFIWCKAKEEDKAAALRDAGFDMSIDGEGFFSIQYQNANNSVRVTDDFMRAVENDERLAADRAHDGRADRRADPGAPADARDRRGRVALRRPGRAVRHDDQQLAHLPGERADQRVQPVLRVHARRRLGLQPRLAQPDEVPPRGRHFRRRARSSTSVDLMLLAQEIIVGPSSYPTEEIGANARAFRQLGLGYANLGALPDEQRHAVRLRCGPRRRGGDHRADDRPRLRAARRESLPRSAPMSAMRRTASRTTP
jgi:ribonucleoside-diphosphate reductase alpha chain